MESIKNKIVCPSPVTAKPSIRLYLVALYFLLLTDIFTLTWLGGRKRRDGKATHRRRADVFKTVTNDCLNGETENERRG